MTQMNPLTRLPFVPKHHNNFQLNNALEEEISYYVSQKENLFLPIQKIYDCTFKRLPFLFQPNKLESWETYFPETNSNENYTGQTSNSPYQIQSRSSHLYISQCSFSNVKQTTIRYSSSLDSLLLVELCSFNECSTSSEYGGAIFFSDQGQCVLSSVCGVRCSTNDGKYGQFCYIYVSDDPQHKNYIIDSSVTLTKQTNSFETIRHENGDFSCKGVNVSNNEVNQVSGIMIYNPSTSFISFSSFRNNRAKGSTYSYICIDFVSNSHQMNQTNIIENNQDTSDCGILYAVNTKLT